MLLGVYNDVLAKQNKYNYWFGFSCFVAVFVLFLFGIFLFYCFLLSLLLLPEVYKLVK